MPSYTCIYFFLSSSLSPHTAPGEREFRDILYTHACVCASRHLTEFASKTSFFLCLSLSLFLEDALFVASGKLCRFYKISQLFYIQNAFPKGKKDACARRLCISWRGSRYRGWKLVSWLLDTKCQETRSSRGRIIRGARWKLLNSIGFVIKHLYVLNVVGHKMDFKYANIIT